MTLVLSGVEARQRCNYKFFLIYFLVSFEAMQITKNKNYLELNEIIEFFTNSWLYGFRFIYYYINSKFKEELITANVYIPKKLSQLENFVFQNSENIKSYVVISLKSIGLVDPSKGVDFETYKKWAEIDHSLEISYFNKRFKFAMNLMCLNEVGLSLEGQGMNYQV